VLSSPEADPVRRDVVSGTLEIEDGVERLLAASEPLISAQIPR
jgi:hypothetical protein